QGDLLVAVALPQGLVEHAQASGPPLQGERAVSMPVWRDATTRLRAAPGLVAARVLMYEDLWVTASLPREAALAAWSEQALIIVGATLLLSALLVLAGVLVALNL